MVRLPRPLTSFGVLYIGPRAWIASSATAFQPVRLMYVISQNRTCTYCPTPFRELGAPKAPPGLAPTHTTSGDLVDTGGATCVAFLCLGASWSSDAESSLSYTRNVRTVNVTYWGRIFFCCCLVVFGVSRYLGFPSGGVCGWRGHIRDEGRREA